MDYILIIIWFIFLIKWADMLVDWASSVAKKYNISNLVIWLTIVAFWTSAPELVVSLISAFKGSSDIAVSNVIWSNISNILFILWVTAFFYPIAMPKSTVKNEIPFLILITIIFSLILIDWIISRSDAFILIIFFVWFLYYTFKISKQKTEEEENIQLYSTLKSLVFIWLWLTWLILWWKFIVDSAVNIASSFWVPESFIWVTIIAIWTSLPELASSIMAAIKKNTDMAVWAIVWSNIFNILWIIWLSWLVKPLNWYENISIDLYINIAATVMIFIFAYTFKKHFIDRIEWIIMFVLFVLFIAYRIFDIL